MQLTCHICMRLVDDCYCTQFSDYIWELIGKYCAVKCNRGNLMTTGEPGCKVYQLSTGHYLHSFDNFAAEFAYPC